MLNLSFPLLHPLSLSLSLSLSLTHSLTLSLSFSLSLYVSIYLSPFSSLSHALTQSKLQLLTLCSKTGALVALKSRSVSLKMEIKSTTPPFHKVTALVPFFMKWSNTSRRETRSFPRAKRTRANLKNNTKITK